MKKLASLLLLTTLGFAQAPKPTTIEDLKARYDLAVTQQQLAAEKLRGIQAFTDYLDAQKSINQIIQEGQKLQADQAAAAAKKTPVAPAPPAPPKK